MRFVVLATLALSWSVQSWMQHGFYPVLLLVLVAASLGVPIPEDVPLIAAGVILSQQPESASWAGTLAVALLGVMCGDVVLYVLGSRWGPDVFQHRWVQRLITPKRYRQTTMRFRRYGMWMCFFGRFIMGVRAAMCLTAGVTRLSFWRFILADLAGAVLSIPLLVWLGYWFASTIPTLRAYVHVVQWGLLVGAACVVLYFALMYKRPRQRHKPNRSESVSDSDEPPPPSGSSRASEPISAPERQIPPTQPMEKRAAQPKPETCA